MNERVHTTWFRVLEWICPTEFYEGIEGDLLEEFNANLTEGGPGYAKRKLVWNIIKFMRPGILLRNKVSRFNRATMIKNYWLIYRRNLIKNKVPSFLNLSGLIIGMTSVFLMTLYIQSELSFDSYPVKSKHIYRVVFGPDDNTGSTYTSHVLGTTLEDRYPDVKVIRFNNAGSAQVNFKVGEKQFMESAFFFTDPEMLDVFSIPLAEGNIKTCLEKPFSMVLTRRAAEKYFGDVSPMNKSITIDWGGTFYDIAVTGVIDEWPVNSHFAADYLLSMATAERIFQPQSFFTDWSANFCVTYAYVPGEKSLEAIGSEITTLYKKNLGREVPADTQLRLQPLQRIHLYSNLSGELRKNSDSKYLWIAVGIAISVLLISLINYANILVALFTLRLKEIGIRKSLGARSRSILRQFFTESMINLIVAFSVAVLLLLVVLPWLSQSFASNWTLDKIVKVDYIWVGPLAVLFVGCMAGIYPSLLVANISAGSILYGKVKRIFTNSRTRNVMVGVQLFVASVVLIGSLFIWKQLTFMENESMGFYSGDIISVPQGRAIRERGEYVKHEMSQTGKVISSTLSSHLPTKSLNFKAPAMVEGGNPDGTNDPYLISLISVDFDFFSTFGIKLASGRTFSPDFPSDSTNGFIINEAAARALRWEAPIGKEISMTYNVGNGTVETRKGKVIGVIKDFHFESLHKTIEPMVMIYKPFWFYYVSFRTIPGDAGATINTLRDKWATIAPNVPFDYVFMSDRLDQLYSTERTLAKGSGIFSIIAISISCLGLFGLVSFLVQTRTKEIAIRKVLGAGFLGIFGKLYGNIMLVVCLSSVLAIPISWFIMNGWLDGFAYHVNSDPTIFISAFIIISLISTVIIFNEILKATNSKPTEALKSE